MPVKNMTESKQKRKTPLTTIAISQEYAQNQDEYIKNFALTRKGFVELAIDYFLSTGFDICGEAFDLSPLERITDRLGEQEKELQRIQEENNRLCIKVLQAYKDKAHRELCRVRDDQKTIGKIKVNTEL